jgi:hypothetical protein
MQQAAPRCRAADTIAAAVPRLAAETQTRGQEPWRKFIVKSAADAPKTTLKQAAHLADALADGTPARDKIALTLASDTVRELI